MADISELEAQYFIGYRSFFTTKLIKELIQLRFLLKKYSDIREKAFIE